MQVYGNIADIICGSPQIHKTEPATAAVTDTTPSAGISDHSIISWGQCQALEIWPSSHLPIMPEALEALVLLTLLNQTHVGSDSSYDWLQWIFPKIASHTVGSGFCSKSQRGQVVQSGQQRVSSPLANTDQQEQWDEKELADKSTSLPPCNKLFLYLFSG